MVMLAHPTETLKLSSNSDRRRGVRVRQTRPVNMFDPSAARFFGGETRDVSATGLRLSLPSDSPVEVGKVLTVHVGLTREGHALAHRRSTMPARVIWLERDFGSSEMEIGVEFLASIAARLNAA